MTDFRCYIQRSLTAYSLDVFVAGHGLDLDGPFSMVVKEIAGPDGTKFERVPEDTIIPFNIRMNEDVAKALMLGFLEYFGEYREDVKLLRQDYNEE